MLCAECVDVSYDPRISQMIECVVDNDSARAAGMENVQVGILDTGATEVGGRKCTSVEGGCINRLGLGLGSASATITKAKKGPLIEGGKNKGTSKEAKK